MYKCVHDLGRWLREIARQKGKEESAGRVEWKVKRSVMMEQMKDFGKGRIYTSRMLPTNYVADEKLRMSVTRLRWRRINQRRFAKRQRPNANVHKT